MFQLMILPILIPLIAGFSLIILHRKSLALRRSINLGSLLLLSLLNIYLMTVVQSGVYQVYWLGDWAPPFGIVLVLDKLAALMLILTSTLALGSLVYAILSDLDSRGVHFHALFQLLLFGLNGTFLTGDVFNLFVFFEVLLLASYGLLLHGGGRFRNKAGLHYVVINLVGSSLFLIAVGVLYGTLGTLNIADMAVKVATIQADNVGLVAAAGLLLLIVFAIKGAVFPFYLWLPGAYTHTSASVAALFAIMTKVGIYAILRVHGTVFAEQAGVLAHYHLPWLLGLGMITLLMASLGVIAANRLREQVAYLVLASVGTLLIGIGLNSHEGISAALYYLVHSTLIAGALFLLADVIRNLRGDNRDHLQPGRPMKHALMVGSSFMFAAVAIVGLPPLSGFIGKTLILVAALHDAWFVWIFAVVLFSGLLLIIALMRTGSLLFYRPNPQEELNFERKHFRVTAFAVTIVMFAISPLMVLFAGDITGFLDRVAWQYFDTHAYINAVLQAKQSW